MRRTGGRALGLVTVMLAAGCTTVSGSAVPVESAETTTGSSLSWTLPGVRVLSEPVLSGGLVIVYGELEKQFQVVAVDPATGQIAWNRRTHGSHVIPALAELEIAAVDDRVAFIEADIATGGDPLRITVVDAASGVEIGPSSRSFTEETSRLVTFPEPCGDSVCVVSQDRDDLATLQRVDLDDGSMTAVPTDRTTSISSIGAGLFAVARGEGELLVDGGRGGFVVRSADVARDGAINRSSAGTAAEGSRIVLTTTSYDFDGDEFDLGTSASLLGIDQRTGRQVWREPRTNLQCLLMGLLNEAVPLRCRWDAGATGTYTEDGKLTTHSAGVVLERYDPSTGAAVWWVRLAAGVGRNAEHNFGFVDAGHLSVPGPVGWLTIDVTDGSIGPATDAPVMCRPAADVDTWEIAASGARTMSPWWTTDLFAWCDRDGISGVTGPWPSWAGVRAGGRQIVTTEHGLQAFAAR